MTAIVDLAQSRGSTATTAAGAKRFLLAHMPAPIHGLAVLGTGRKLGPWWRRDHSAATAYRLSRTRTRYYAWLDRIAAEHGVWTLDAAEHEAQRLSEAVASRIGRRLESAWPYRRSKSRWAGGDHVVSVTIADSVPVAHGETRRAWSKNGKWSGTDSRATLAITARAVAEFGERGLIVGGLVTLDAERVGPREYRAVWAEQSRGVSLRSVHGWIIRGYHVTANSLEQARARAAIARRPALAAALAWRASSRRDSAALRHVWVGTTDSIAAGNCPAGTDQARRRVLVALRADGDVGAVRADWLLRACPDLRVYALRAAGVAASRAAAAS